MRGNHDRVEAYGKAFEKLNYSFDHKGWRIMGIDIGVRFHKTSGSELPKVPSGMPVICWRHYGPRAREAENIAKHGVRLFMSGHTHGHRTGMQGKLRDVNLATFSTGFAVVDVMKDRRISVEWRPHRVSKRLSIVHPAEGSTVTSGVNTLLVSAFDSYRDVVKVEFNAGAGWKAMKKSTRRAWTAEAALGGGQLQVRVKDSAGEAWQAVSKYTAAPRKVAIKTGTDWPVAGGTSDNQRRAAEALAPGLRLAWHAQVGGRVSQPVLAGGRLYVTVANQDFEGRNAVVCLDAVSGKVLWRAPLLTCSMCPPAVAKGVVAAMDRHGRAYGFDAKTGKELWRVEGIAGAYGSYGKSGRLTAAGGMFLVGNLHALAAADGKELWKASVAAASTHPPAVGDGKVVGAGSGWQKCLELKSGKELWKSARSSYRATIFVDGKFLISGYKLVNAADGKQVKTIKGSGGPDGAVTANGKVFIASAARGRVQAFDLVGGQTLWQFPAREKLAFSPPTISGGHVYVWGSDGWLRALSLTDGKEVWKRPLGGKMSGPVVSGNALFIAGDDGCVYALVSGR